MSKKIGIWGLGIVGKSVIRFLRKYEKKYDVKAISVMDKRAPTVEDKVFLKEHRVAWIDQSKQQQFFEENDYIIPSPGIDVGNKVDKIKLIEEIDLFFDVWKDKKNLR